jgi:hypothetical protein
MHLPYRIPAENHAARQDELEVAAFGAATRRAQTRARWTGCTTLLGLCGAACALLAQTVDVRAPTPPKTSSYWARVAPSVCFCACGQDECDSRMADQIIECCGGRCQTVWTSERCTSSPMTKICR